MRYDLINRKYYTTGGEGLQALNKRNIGCKLLCAKGLGASARPPKWEFLPNPSVTKLAADRFPIGAYASISSANSKCAFHSG